MHKGTPDRIVRRTLASCRKWYRTSSGKHMQTFELAQMGGAGSGAGFDTRRLHSHTMKNATHLPGYKASRFDVRVEDSHIYYGNTRTHCYRY